MSTVVELPDGTEVDVEADDPAAAAKAAHTYWGQKSGSAGGLPPITPLGVPGGTEFQPPPELPKPTGIFPTIGRIAEPAIKAATEAIQPEVPLGAGILPQEPAAAEAELAKVRELPPLAQAGIYGAAVPIDVVKRAMEAVAAGGTEAVAQTFREAGFRETEVEQLTQDVTAYVTGRMGEAGAPVPGKPRVSTPEEISSFLEAARARRGFEPFAAWREEQFRVPSERRIEAERPAGEVPPPPPEAPAPVAPTPQPFPNAATDELAGYNVEGMTFAEKPVEGEALPGLPERPAYGRPGGPGEKPIGKRQQELLREEARTALEEAGVTSDTTAELLNSIRKGGGIVEPELAGALTNEKARDAVAKYSDALKLPSDAKAAMKAKAAGLRQAAEGLKERKAALTELEKYELAKEEQGLKQRGEERKRIEQEKVKRGLRVIEGGPPKPTPPDPNTVPSLPPDNYGLPPVVPAPASDPTIIVPDMPAAPGEFYGVVPTEGDLPDFAIPFGTPADLEAQLAKYGEKQVKIVTIDPRGMPRHAYTARQTDLPLGMNEGHRVSGPPESRPYLRAAIDSMKVYNQRLLQHLGPEAADAWGTAAHNYDMFVKLGGRVEPTPGRGLSVLNPRMQRGKITERPAAKQPRTTRTRATHFFVPALERGGVSLFSRVNRGYYEPGVALDIAKLKPDALTGLPFEAARLLYPAPSIGDFRPTSPTPSIILMDLEKVGVYFTTPPNALLLHDVDRFLWKASTESPVVPEGILAGPRMREFTDLLKRGMRIRVTPETEDFLAIHSEVQKAAIPGVSFPVGKYAWGIKREPPKAQPRLNITYDNLYRVAVIPEQRKVLRDLTRITRVLLRKLGLKINLRIVPVNGQIMANVFNIDAGTDAAFNPLWFDANGDAIIALNLDRSFYPGTGAVNITKMVTDYGHETGHLLIRSTWKSLPYAVQEQLVTLAERLGLGTRTASMMQAYAQMQDISNFNTYARRQARFPFTTDPSFVNYFTEFEEIIAKEMSRYTTSLIRNSGKRAGSFIGRLAREFNTMFGLLKQYDPDYFEPRQATLDWIEYIKSAAPQDIGLAADMSEKMQKSMKPSGSLALPGVEHPETGATVNGREQTSRAFSGPGGGGGPPDFWRGFNIAARAADGLNWLAKKTLAVNEIAQANRVRLPEMSWYVDEARSFNAFLNGLAGKHELRLKEINKLDQTNGDRLARLIFYMAQMEYRTPYEKRNKVQRHPTRQEFAATLRRFGIEPGSPVLDVYLKIRGDFDNFLEMTQKVAEDRARRELHNRNPEAYAEKMREITAAFQHLRNSPYFPMTRFGDYYLSVRDINGKIVYAENFSTPEERDGAAPRVRNSYPTRSGFELKTDMKINEELRPFAGQPARTLEVIRDRLNIDPESELGRQFEVLMYEMGPEKSFKKHWLPREGIPGFSADVKRVYSDYFMHGNRQLARTMFEYRLQDQVNKMYAAKERFANSREKDQISSLADFTQGHLNELMNPAEDYARIRGFMYFQTLAFVPYTALVQLSQLMFSWSHLMAAYGPIFGTKEMAKGMGRATANVDKIFTNMAYDADPIKRQARELAYSQGVLRDGLAAEMANVATGSIMSRYTASTRIGRAAGWLNFWGGAMISAVDNFGRHVVFDAAYDAAGKDQRWVDEILREYPDYKLWYDRTRADPNLGWTELQAKQFIAGAHATNETFFETGRWAKPEILKGKWGVVFFLYTFTRKILHFLATAKGGLTSLAVLWAMAGTMGLPFAEDINNVIRNAVGLILGRDWSPERAFRTLLVNTFGTKSVVPEIVMHGLASQIGMNRSISLGRIIPGLADIDVRSGLRPEEFAGEAGLGMSGVLGGLVMNTIRFLAYSPYAFSDPKRWEQVAPRGARGVMRAARHAVEGSERTSKGAKMPGTEFDWTDPGDALTLIAEAGGFPPARIRVQQEFMGQFIESKEFYNGQRTALRGKLNQALDSKDQASINENLAAIGDFNKKVAAQGFPGLAIDSKSIQASYKLHRRGVAMQEAGLPVEKMYVPLSQELRRVYGAEVETVSKKKVK